MVQIASECRILCPCTLHSPIIRVSEIGARGSGISTPTSGTVIKFYRILKSNTFANHISVHYMLIGSTQVLQGHCPLVLPRRRVSDRFTEVSGAVKTTSMGSEGGEFVTGCRSNMKTDLTHHIPHTQYLVLCLVNVS